VVALVVVELAWNALLVAGMKLDLHDVLPQQEPAGRAGLTVCFEKNIVLLATRLERLARIGLSGGAIPPGRSK
jgi:hypothetical protein